VAVHRHPATVATTREVKPRQRSVARSPSNAARSSSSSPPSR
jgi:hypothetical protein